MSENAQKTRLVTGFLLSDGLPHRVAPRDNNEKIPSLRGSETAEAIQFRRYHRHPGSPRRVTPRDDNEAVVFTTTLQQQNTSLRVIARKPQA